MNLNRYRYKMPNLSAYTTINRRVEKFKDDYALDDLPSAFSFFALETILNLTEDEILEAITKDELDGGFDGGYDAVRIIGNDIHIFNFKFATTFEGSKKNFPSSEIDKVINTTRDITNKATLKQSVNGVLWDIIQEIWSLYDTNAVLNYKFHFCSNKEHIIEDEKKRVEASLGYLRSAEFFYYNQVDLESKILERKYKKVNGQIKFHDKQYFERADGYVRGVVATIAATDLLELLRDPENPNKLNEDVFDENVRIYLKRDNKINQKIYDSALSQDNSIFWYLNNGINIVCSECTYEKIASPTVELKDIQIVNGGQTTHALFEAYLVNPTALSEVRLIVRISQTTREGFSEKISESTNTQTPVRTRDLRANDAIQKALEEQFKTLGFYYERKRNLYEDRPKSTRLNNELLGQIYLAYYLNMPSEARDKKGLVFGDEYDKIFNVNETTAQRMLVPYHLYLPLEQRKKIIQGKKRRNEEISERDAFVSRAIFHLLYACKIIADKELLDITKDDIRQSVIERAVQYIRKLTEIEQEKTGEKYTHDKFFKEIGTNKKIEEYLGKQYAQPEITFPSE
jgi:hypothetical protein